MMLCTAQNAVDAGRIRLSRQKFKKISILKWLNLFENADPITSVVGFFIVRLAGQWRLLDVS